MNNKNQKEAYYFEIIIRDGHFPLYKTTMYTDIFPTDINTIKPSGFYVLLL